jgi:hypothetical protein
MHRIVITDGQVMNMTIAQQGTAKMNFKYHKSNYFVFTTASRTALGPTQHPIQWVQRSLFPGVKRPGREADHSPPSSAEVGNVCDYTSTHPIRLHGVALS